MDLLGWIGLLAGLTLSVVGPRRYARVPATTVLDAARQPMVKEILQAKYALGEITSKQSEFMRRDIA